MQSPELLSRARRAGDRYRSVSGPSSHGAPGDDQGTAD
jgi:hypothetical protein